MPLRTAVAGWFISRPEAIMSATLPLERALCWRDRMNTTPNYIMTARAGIHSLDPRALALGVAFRSSKGSPELAFCSPMPQTVKHDQTYLLTWGNDGARTLNQTK